MTIEIPLTQGQVAVVDDIDADLAEFKWFARRRDHASRYYAARRNPTRKPTQICMGALILERKLGRELTKGEYTDHIDRNSLNNCRENLRVATRSQNAANSKRRSDNKSGLKGICFFPDRKKYRAEIRVNGKRIRLGYFADPKAAHEAYLAAARRYYGEFANDGTEE